MPVRSSTRRGLRRQASRRPVDGGSTTRCSASRGPSRTRPPRNCSRKGAWATACWCSSSSIPSRHRAAGTSWSSRTPPIRSATPRTTSSVSSDFPTRRCCSPTATSSQVRPTPTRARCASSASPSTSNGPSGNRSTTATSSRPTSRSSSRTGVGCGRAPRGEPTPEAAGRSASTACGRAIATRRRR